MSKKKNTDEIRVRGIRSGGYGQLPKIIMVDPDIPLAAKGLYAYFVSFTGGGNNKAFPTVKTILEDLRMTNTTYYKDLNMLVELGLISVEQKNGGFSGKGFKNNIYTVEFYSESYVRAATASSNPNRLLDEVRVAGDLFAAGYGNVPRLVMTDNELSLEAKALYAYICVFSGTSHSATPGRKKAIFHLKTSRDSYAKYGRELEQHGYISRKRVQENGRFAGVVFTLKQSKSTEEQELAPCTKISDTIKSHTKISDTTISRTIISETNTTGSLTQPVLNTTRVNQSISRVRAYETSAYTAHDRGIDSQIGNSVLEEMAESRTLPYRYCYDHEKLESAIKLLTDGDFDPNSEPAEKQLYNLFTSAMVEMLDASMPNTVIKGAQLSFAKIYEGFVPVIEAGYDDFGEPYAIAFQLYTGVKRRYEAARMQNRIRNPLNYMKAVIWTELTTAEVEIEDQIAYDFAERGEKTWQK